mmetsp:Transcript_75218/g.193960  ORF Transcript_75218/g.193960 Transcript_75218/m.193960 type:complete len:283 (-) Transcript_75218:239-1087(-)
MGCSKSSLSGVQDPAAGRSGGSAPSSDVIAKKVAQAKKTGVLALRECKLKAVPASTLSTDAATIRTIDLTNNVLKSLPETINAWQGVQSLLLGQNQLAELPLACGQLAGLQKLVLTDNHLRDLPMELSQLGKVKVLQLDGNRLGPRLLAEAVCGALASTLEELNLSRNGLKELPASLGQLTALKSLELGHNELQELPKALAGLTKLQHLDAEGNKISSVSSEVLEGCTSLSELWLKGNPIERLKLQETPGFAAFLERRKQRLDAKIGSNVVGKVDLRVCGLD